MRSAFSLSCRLSIRARSSLEALSWGGETGHSLRAPNPFTDYSVTASLPTSLMAFLFPTDPQGLLRRVLCIQSTFPHSVASTPTPIQQTWTWRPLDKPRACPLLEQVYIQHICSHVHSCAQ